MGSKKPAGVVRTTISLPAGLREEMQRYGGRVNWSGLAAEAFRRRIEDLKRHEKGVVAVDDVIERLKKSAEDGKAKAQSDGEALGRRWAERRAGARELRRLDRAVEGEDAGELFDLDATGAYSAAERMYFVMHPADDGDRAAANTFWEAVTGNDASMVEDPGFLDGFADGALAVWREVRDRVEG